MRIWFTLSVAANIALVAVLLWPSSRRAPVASSVVRASDSEKTSTENKAATLTGRDQTLGWQDSLTQFRTAGVPSAILARLVVEKVAQKWTPLVKEHEQQYLNDKITAKQLAEFHDQRANEEEQELRMALGDGYAAWDKQQTVDTMYLGGLEPTSAQRDALYPLQKDYLKRLHDFEVAKREGRMDEQAFSAALAQAELNFKNQLVAIIGPDRVDGLAGKEDPVQQVRQDFARLKLTESQMSQLAGVQQKWSDTRAEMAKALEQTRSMDVAYEGDLKAIDRARDEEFSRILGQEAFDAWQKPQDDRYSIMKNNAGIWNLAPQQVDSVFNTIRAYDLAVFNFEYQAQIREHGGQAVDWTAVQSKIAEYTRQTETALRQQLGQERFEKIQQSQILGLRSSPQTLR